MAYEYHLAPSQVLAESPRMQTTMMRYLRWRASEMRKAQEEARR